MTHELTHEQAFQLRLIGAQFGARTEYFGFDHAPLMERGWVRKYSAKYDNDDVCLTDAGREALAKYDREWVTVRRADVQAALRIFESHECCDEVADAFIRFRAALEGK